MFNKNQASMSVRLFLIFILISGIFGAIPVAAKSDPNSSNISPVLSPEDLETLPSLAETTVGNWSALGSNLAGIDGALSYSSAPGVYDIAVVGTDVYVAGCFTNAGGDPTADFIAKWDGTSWSGLGDDGAATPDGAIKNCVFAIAINGADIYAGGVPTLWINDAPAPQAKYLAKWNGATWSWVSDDGAGGSSFNYPIYDMAISGNDIYVGGFFTDVKNGSTTLTEADYIAKWNILTGNWSALGNDGSGNGAIQSTLFGKGSVQAIAIDGTNIYAGGYFDKVYNGLNLVPDATFIVKWNGTEWSALGSRGSINNPYGFGPISSSVWAIAVSGNDVYVGGDFTNVTQNNVTLTAADYLAKWDALTGNWSALGSDGNGNGSLNSTVGVNILVNGINVYVTGAFTNVNNNSTVLTAADYIAKWDGTNWFALGSNGSGSGSLNANTYALGLLGNKLFVGGDFANVNNNGAVLKTADYVAAYDICTSGPITVQNTNDSGSGSLRQAIADICPSGTINFDVSLGSYSIIDLFSPLVIDKDLTIDGSNLSMQLPLNFRDSSNIQILDSTVKILNLTIERGYSNSDGGAIWSNGNLILINSSIKDSFAAGSGGAIYSLGSLTIQGSALYNNEAGSDAGGIFIGNNGQPISIVNTTISQNYAQQQGGGIYTTGSPIVSIINSTIAQNNALTGSQITSKGLSEVIFNNTIVACWGFVNNNCLDLHLLPSKTNSILGSWGETYGLEELADNGGPTKTMAVLPSSPLIDAGDNAICANQLVNNIDQRGVIRPYGSNCDIGAFEAEYRTISGNAGVGGATLRYGYGLFTVADNDGNYSIKVLPGWSGIVIPVKLGYTFNPVKKNYVDVQNNVTDQNYTATANIYTPSGNAGDTWRVSVTSNGIQADDDTYDPSISADGRYVAYWSFAQNLVPGDGATDVVVYDNQTGQTSAISVDSNGIPLDCNSYDPSVSADGRYVAFTSCAWNQPFIVYVYDRHTGSLDSVARGTQPSISADGRYVAYHSIDNPNFQSRVFVEDILTRTGTQISISTTGSNPDGDSYLPSISANGRYIVFYSSATNLINNDTNGVEDVFVYDLQTDDITRVSVNSSGTQANGGSFTPSISGDGRYVAFYSSATNLVDNDTNGVDDVFVHDLQTGTTTRVSVSSVGIQGNLASDQAHISANGTVVTFRSNATNLTANDTNGVTDIFMYDRQTGKTKRVSVASSGAQGNGASPSAYSAGFDLSADGKYLAFSSEATNLVTGDTNGYSDIFVHDTSPFIDVTIGGNLMDSYALASGETVAPFYNGVAGGPVLVESTNGENILASEHRNYQTSFSETLGYPDDQLTTKYWFTRYAYNANVKTWLLVANPSSSTAEVEIYIGNLTTPIESFDLGAGATVSKFYNGVANGPVLVKSTNGVEILASEHRNYQTSFSETLGYPDNQLTTEYWFTRYAYNANVKTWLLVANPSSSTAEVSVYIGDQVTPIESFNLGAGATVSKFYNGVANGPVRVESTNGVNILASEHRNYQTSFSETLGYPDNQLTTEYWFTRYAYNANVKTWLLIANPSGSTAEVDVYIGSSPTLVASYSIAAGATVTPFYDGVAAGLVRVESTNGVNILASEHRNYQTSFSETLGYPNTQLTTKYWFTRYAYNANVKTWLLIANPQ